MPTVNVLHFSGSSAVIPLKDTMAVPEALKSGGFVWIDIDDPTADVLQTIFTGLGIHPLCQEDCLDDNQIPKLDMYSDHAFLLFNDYVFDGKDLAVKEVDFIISPTFLVTVRNLKTPDPGSFQILKTRIDRVSSMVSKGSDFLLHSILDDLIDRKFTFIEAIQDEIDALEEKIHAVTTEFDPMLLLDRRRQLITLRKSIFHEREMLIKICRRDLPFISEKAGYYFRDIYDHLTKFFEFIEIGRETIGNLFELHQTMRSNCLALLANQTNEVMKRLTLITTIFMPLTFLSGVGGMSEFSMMTGAENWKTSYPLFMLGMCLIGWGTYRWLKWLRWA